MDWSDITDSKTGMTVGALSTALKYAKNVVFYDPAKDPEPGPADEGAPVNSAGDVIAPAITNLQAKIDAILADPTGSGLFMSGYAEADAEALKANWQFFQVRFYDLINLCDDSEDPATAEYAYNLFHYLNARAGSEVTLTSHISLFTDVGEKTFTEWIHDAWKDPTIGIDPRVWQLEQQDGILAPSDKLAMTGSDGLVHSPQYLTQTQEEGDAWLTTSNYGYAHQQQAYEKKLIYCLQISDMAAYLMAQMKATPPGAEMSDLFSELDVASIAGTGSGLFEPSSASAGWTPSTKLFVESLLGMQVKTNPEDSPSQRLSLAEATNTIYSAITDNMNEMFRPGKYGEDMAAMQKVVRDLILSSFANGLWQAEDTLNLAEGNGGIVEADGQQLTFAPKGSNIVLVANGRLPKPDLTNMQPDIMAFEKSNGGSLWLYGIDDAKRNPIDGVSVNGESSYVWNGMEYTLTNLRPYADILLRSPAGFLLQFTTPAEDQASSETLLAKIQESNDIVSYQSGVSKPGIEVGVIAAHRIGSIAGEPEATSGAIASVYKALMPYSPDMINQILGNMQGLFSLVSSGTATSADTLPISWVGMDGQAHSAEFTLADSGKATWSAVEPQDLVNWLVTKGGYDSKVTGHWVTTITGTKVSTEFVLPQPGDPTETSPFYVDKLTNKEAVNPTCLNLPDQIAALDISNKQQHLIDLSSWDSLVNMWNNNPDNLQFALIENRYLEVRFEGERSPASAAIPPSLMTEVGSEFASNYGKFFSAMSNLVYDNTRNDFTYQNVGYYPDVSQFLVGQGPLAERLRTGNFIPAGWQIKMAYDLETNKIECSGEGYTFMIQNIEDPDRYFTVSFDTNPDDKGRAQSLVFTIIVPDEMTSDALLGQDVGSHPFSADAFTPDGLTPLSDGYAIALEEVGNAIDQMLTPGSTPLSATEIGTPSGIVQIQASGFLNELVWNTQQVGPNRLVITKWDPQLLTDGSVNPNGAVNVEFQTTEGTLPDGQIWYFKAAASASGGEPTTISVRNGIDPNGIGWMDIPFNQLAPDSWFDQIMQPVDRVESIVQSIGTDGGVHQPGRLESDIVPVVSSVPIYDTEGNVVGHSLRTSFTISMDTADGGTLEYQCQMQCIDNPSVSRSNGIEIFINGFSVGNYIPSTFAEYFTKMAELHSQIMLEGGQFTAATSGDPHVGCTITLPIKSRAGVDDVRLLAQFGYSGGGWVGSWVKEIDDGMTQSTAWITEDNQITENGKPGFRWFFKDVKEMVALLVNRESLIDVVQKMRSEQGRAAYLRLSYDRYKTGVQMMNRINYAIDYTLYVNEFNPSTGMDLTISPLPIDLVGFMNGLSGAVALRDDSNRFNYLTEGLSAAINRLNSLENPEIELLIVPGQSLLSFNRGRGGVSTTVGYASEIEEDTSGKRVFENFALDLGTGDLYLRGYVIPAAIVGNWIVNTYQSMIDLGNCPNANPTIKFVLANLACLEITIIPAADTHPQRLPDDVFRVRFQVVDPTIVVSNPIIGIQVSYDPTSTSADPDVTDIIYSVGKQYLRTHALDDPNGVTTGSRLWNDQPIHFTDWLKANQVTDYSTLSWTGRYQDFILFLRGQVTNKWDPGLLPNESP